MPPKASAKRASAATPRCAKRRKTVSDGATKSKSWADLPMELKLLIFSFLEEKQRVITFKAKYSSTAAPKLYLAKALRPPLLLSICHETRAKALKRFCDTLSGPNGDFRVDFKTDIFEVVPLPIHGGRAFPTGGRPTDVLNKVDRKRVRNFSIRVGDSDPTPYVLSYLIPLVYVFPMSKYVFPNRALERPCFKSSGNRLKEAYKAKRKQYPDCGRRMKFTCHKCFPQACYLQKK